MRRRKRSQLVIDRDKQLLELIEPLKADHPAWGYGRVWAYLRYRMGLVVGKNRVYRILKALKNWIGQYNADYPHSEINHRTP